MTRAQKFEGSRKTLRKQKGPQEKKNKTLFPNDVIIML